MSAHEATSPGPSESVPSRDVASMAVKKSGSRGSLRRYIFRRLASTAGLMIGVTLVLFLLVTAVPGDPIDMILGETAAADPVVRQVIIDRYGLDQPLVTRYFTYMGNLFQGDLGESMRTRRPMTVELARAIPATLELGILAGIIAALTGITLGTIAALNREKLVDQIIRVVTLAGISMPIFWTALVSFYVFHFRLGLLPSIGRLKAGASAPPHVTGAFTIDALIDGDLATFWDAFSHLLLPALVLGAYTMTLLARFTRSAVLEILNEDYIRTARAKGLPFRTVVNRHVVRAALVPVVTVVGLMFGSVLSGTVLIEAIFGFPGVGNLMYLSALLLDVQAIMSTGLVIAVVYVTVNFIVDILYGIIDPRIRLG